MLHAASCRLPSTLPLRHIPAFRCRLLPPVAPSDTYPFSVAAAEQILLGEGRLLRFGRLRRSGGSRILLLTLLLLGDGGEVVKLGLGPGGGREGDVSVSRGSL